MRSLPVPTPIFRIMHVDNLHICLSRRGIHAPNFMPNDGLVYRIIHNAEIQSNRRVRRINCGPCGVVHDYLAFYFGPRSPMLLQLNTGRVQGYTESQEPIIYLVSTAQVVQQSGAGFVFSDGHGVAVYTKWFDDLGNLSQLDWDAVYATYWKDDVDDMDRQRKKQAEFLVHRFCPWTLINEIGVISSEIEGKVSRILSNFPSEVARVVRIHKDWYY